MVSAGGNASGGTGSSAYTIGQMVYGSENGANFTSLQGMQLPYEIYIVDGIEDCSPAELQCVVYPNPTTSHIKLRIESFKSGNLRFELYDMMGKMVLNQKVTGPETLIPMNNLLPAVYFLKVIEHDKEVKSFKVIKNH
jgi:hypothetical protein